MIQIIKFIIVFTITPVDTSVTSTSRHLKVKIMWSVFNSDDAYSPCFVALVMTKVAKLLGSVLLN